MEIIKNNQGYADRPVRVTKDEYCFTGSIDDYSNDSMFVVLYKVQVKVLFFWITIKSFEYGYQEFIDQEEYLRNRDFVRNCAEELYEHLTKNED